MDTSMELRMYSACNSTTKEAVRRFSCVNAKIDHDINQQSILFFDTKRAKAINSCKSAVILAYKKLSSHK